MNQCSVERRLHKFNISLMTPWNSCCLSHVGTAKNSERELKHGQVHIFFSSKIWCTLHFLPYLTMRCAWFMVWSCVSAVPKTTPGDAERATLHSVSMHNLKRWGSYEASVTVYEESKSAIWTDMHYKQNIWHCYTQCFLLKISQWSFLLPLSNVKTGNEGKSTTFAYFLAQIAQVIVQASITVKHPEYAHRKWESRGSLMEAKQP